MKKSSQIDFELLMESNNKVLTKNHIIFKEILFYIIFLLVLLNNGLAQTWDWVQYAHGPGNDYILDIEVDEKSNVYTTGRPKEMTIWTNGESKNMRGGFMRDGIKPKHLGNHDTFVAKYDSLGNLLWVNRDGGSSTDWGYAVAVDKEGNVYNTGKFNDTMFFGMDTIVASPLLPTNALMGHSFVSKHDKDGKREWFTYGIGFEMGKRKASRAQEIAINSEGHIISTGYIYGRNVFQRDTIGKAKQYWGYCLSQNPDGTVRWVKDFYGASAGLDLVITPADEIIITGRKGNNARDGFQIRKMDKNGNLIWSKTGQGGTSIAVKTTDRGEIYFSGTYNKKVTIDTFNIIGKNPLAKFSKKINRRIYFGKLNSDGEVLLLKNILSCDSTITFYDMEVVNNNIFLCGRFWKNLYLQSDTITSVGSGDGFLACFDTLGNYKWVKQLKGKPIYDCGGKCSDLITTLKVDRQNNLFIGGGFRASMNFDSIYFDITKVIRGTVGFVGKMVLPIEAEIICEAKEIKRNQKIKFTAKGNGLPLTYKWDFGDGKANSTTIKSPEVCYKKKGYKDVQLIISNKYETDTITIKNILKVTGK